MIVSAVKLDTAVTDGYLNATALTPEQFEYYKGKFHELCPATMDLELAWAAMVINTLPGVVPLEWSAGSIPLRTPNGQIDNSLKTAYALDKSRGPMPFISLGFTEDGFDFIRWCDHAVKELWINSDSQITRDYHHLHGSKDMHDPLVRCYRLVFPSMDRHGRIPRWYERMLKLYIENNMLP